MAIRDLASHSAPFVGADELARYWGVSRRQVRKYIDAGLLEAVMLGPRLYRIRTSTAIELERRLKTQPALTLTRTPHRIR